MSSLRGRCLLALLLACSLVSLPAMAQTPAQTPPPRAALDEGTRLYQEGDLQRAEALLRIAIAGLADASLRARAWVVLALVHASRKNLAATREALRAAFTEDPGPPFDRATVAPDVVAMFDSVRADLYGEVQLKGAGEHARLFVGERELGRGSKVRAPIGRHVVRVVSADGYRVFTARDVVVRVNAPAVVVVAYRSRRGRVRIVGPWLGATLRTGDVVVKVGAGEVTLDAGPKRLSLVRGDARAELDVVVKPDAVTDVVVPAPDLATAPMRRRTWGILAMSASAGLAVVGGVLGYLARADANEIGAMTTWDPNRYDSLRTGADRKALAANVLFGVAGAGALTGLILVLTDRSDSVTRTGARLVPFTAGPGLALDVRF